MKVIRIIKKGKKDVTIHLDNQTTLVLALEIFLKSGLRKEIDISENRISFLIEENKKFLIKQKAFRLLGRRQHSIAELKSKLWNKDYDKELIDTVLEELIQDNYLDDWKFAAAFIEEKVKIKRWSKSRLKSELIKKGIKPEIINQFMQEKLSDSDDFNTALIVAKKKCDSLKKKKLEVYEIKSKLSAFLLSKGFNYETIIQVCEKLV